MGETEELPEVRVDAASPGPRVTFSIQDTVRDARAECGSRGVPKPEPAGRVDVAEQGAACWSAVSGQPSARTDPAACSEVETFLDNFLSTVKPR